MNYAARVAWLMQWLQSGFIDIPTARALINMPLSPIWLILANSDDIWEDND